MPASSFIDTNIFIYQIDSADLRKQAIADSIIRDSVANGTGCVSYQVVQECLNVLTRKARVTVNESSALRYLEVVLEPLMQVPASAQLFRQGLQIQARYAFSFYDALIVAGAISAGCSTLLTEDLQHGQRIDSLRIVNPFIDETR